MNCKRAKIKSHFLWRFWKAFGCRRQKARRSLLPLWSTQASLMKFRSLGLKCSSGCLRIGVSEPVSLGAKTVVVWGIRLSYVRRFGWRAFPTGVAFSCLPTNGRPAPLRRRRRFFCHPLCVIAPPRIHLVPFLRSGNLNLAKLAVPIPVFRVIAQAELVVQLLRDLFERIFQPIHAPHL